MDQMDIMKALDGNVKRKSALDVLMQVDEYLDTLNVYAYSNWIKGEIVEGPEIEKYCILVTLKSFEEVYIVVRLVFPPTVTERIVMHSVKPETLLRKSRCP